MLNMDEHAALANAAHQVRRMADKLEERWVDEEDRFWWEELEQAASILRDVAWGKLEELRHAKPEPLET